jgi:hypothetical protein
VTRKLGRTRLVVTVDILGQSVATEVDAELLERIDPPADTNAAAARSVI